MNYIKFLIITFFVSLIFNSSTAHGPSRQKVSEKITINKDSDTVWKIIKDFKNFQWNPSIKSIDVKNNEIGSERVLNFGKGTVTQKLEKINEDKKFIQWRIIKTDNNILPVNSYSAKVFVKENNESTTITYKAGFYRGFMGNDPPEELNDENSKKKVSNFIKDSLKGLKKIAESN